MKHWVACEGMCKGCPMNTTEESAMAYNLGCLPDVSEIFELKRNHNLNWGCHEGGGKVCAGFVAIAKDESIDYKSGYLLDTPHYLGTGEIRKVSK